MAYHPLSVGTMPENIWEHWNQYRLVLLECFYSSSSKMYTSEPDWSHHVMRILIVEDESIIALNTEADLETAGHTVVGLAMTADEAVTLADRCQPDLVLMDARMPDMDGIEATRIIKKKSARTPVIVLSMYTEYQATALAAGASAFVSKGEPPERLLEALSKASSSK